MRIRVTREFAGRITNERRIYPGEYEMSDVALLGVGRYLLDNGFAVQIPLDQQDPEYHEFIAEVTAHMRPENDYGADSDVSGELPESAPTDYAGWTNSALLAEIEHRDIGLREDGGSGSKGAYVKADYVHILKSDDEARG